MPSSSTARKFPEVAGLVDPKVERELFVTVHRIYEHFEALIDKKIAEVMKTNTAQQAQLQETASQLTLVQQQQQQAQKASGLVDIFATKVIAEPSNELAELGGGTVTSVGFQAPSIFNVAGSPISTAGTIVLSINNANFDNRIMSAIQMKRTSAIINATLADYPNNGDWGFHLNTVTSKIWLIYNNNGTLIEVSLADIWQTP